MNKMDVELTLKDIVDFLYPIGSLYYTQDSNFNPNNHFGGTWVQIKDKFILACGETYKINQTGGEASHVLTIDEMPEHSHALYQYPVPTNPQKKPWGYGFTYREDCAKSGFNEESSGIGTMGLSQAHNNMPPFETAFIWKRTGE